MKNCALLVLLLLAAAVYGCAGKSETGNAEVKWSIAVEGGGERPCKFYQRGCRQTGGEKVEATQEEKDGTEVTESWEGVPLKAVLKPWGQLIFKASCWRRRTVTSRVQQRNCGAGRNHSRTESERQRTGEEDGLSRQCDGRTGNMYIKNLAKIIVQQPSAPW